MIKITPMGEEHITGIAQLEKECFSQPWSESGLREELTNNSAVFFAAEDDGKVVGYMGANFILDEGYITNIAVTEKRREEGIGSLLMERMTEEAKNRKLSFISLEVRVSNEKAISLYEKSGFKKLGIRKNFYEKPVEDAAIMTKYL